MYLKKISILVLFFIFIQSSLISFADDFDDYYEETFSPLNSNLTTSHDIPDINARHAVVLDRAS